MKKYLILGLLVSVAAGASAKPRTFTASTTTQGKTRVERNVNVSTTPVQVGALPRGGRGNPLHLFNPKAPRKYFGSPEETVVPDAYYFHAPYEVAREGARYTGLILFGLRW
jgi:hypothetical protein